MSVLVSSWVWQHHRGWRGQFHAWPSFLPPPPQTPVPSFHQGDCSAFSWSWITDFSWEPNALTTVPLRRSHRCMRFSTKSSLPFVLSDSYWSTWCVYKGTIIQQGPTEAAQTKKMYLKLTGGIRFMTHHRSKESKVHDVRFNALCQRSANFQ